MIEKLTKKQKEAIPECIKKWVEMASTPMNHSKAIEYTRKMYKRMGEKNPLIFFGLSPLNTALLASLFFTLIKDKKNIQLCNQLNDQLRNQLDDQLYNQLYNQLNNQLYNQLSSQLYNQLNDQLRNQLNNQLYNQLRNQLNNQLYNHLSAQLYNQLRDQLSDQLNNQLDNHLRDHLRDQLSDQLSSQLYNQLSDQLDNHLRDQLSDQLSSQLYNQLSDQLKTINSQWYLGIFWLTWCGWYEYGKSIGVEFDIDKYDLFVNFNSEVNFIIPYKGVCFISEKPINIHWNNRRLHKDMGMAVEYSDGYGMYFLNGVKVSKEIAETSSDKLDVNLILTENNTQVKAEIIKKIGYSRILKELQADKIDTWREYELYRINKHIDVEPIALLKFNCPSTGTFYSLRVPPEMKSAREAIKWCNHGVDEFLLET